MKKIMMLIFTLLLFSGGCSRGKQVLVIGFTPSETPLKIGNEFTLMKKYLEKETGCQIKVYIPDDYRQLIKAMREDKVDIVLFGPFSYIIAESRQKLDLLIVRKKKDFGVFYNSLIITRMNSTINKISDLHNKKMAFVNSASTSGFMIPQSLFISRHIDADKFFSSYYFSGSHDKVIADVLEGRADAGAVSNTIVARMIIEGKLKEKDLRILWKSGSIPGSPFVARIGLSRHVRDLFINSMLNIHVKDPEALKRFDNTIERYEPIEKGMYNSVRNIVNILGNDYIERNYL